MATPRDTLMAELLREEVAEFEASKGKGKGKEERSMGSEQSPLEGIGYSIEIDMNSGVTIKWEARNIDIIMRYFAFSTDLRCSQFRQSMQGRKWAEADLIRALGELGLERFEHLWEAAENWAYLVLEEECAASGAGDGQGQGRKQRFWTASDGLGRG